MSFWTVVETWTNREDFAAGRVAERGFEVFLPKTRIRVRKNLSKIVAVFPGYFFAIIVDRWRDIEATPGVIGVIKAGDAPARCPSAEIERIKAAQMQNGLIKLPKLPPASRRKIALVQGDPVRILSGPFRGLNALYEGQSPRQRELVLLELLGRRVPLEIGEDIQIAAL